MKRSISFVAVCGAVAVMLAVPAGAAKKFHKPPPGSLQINATADGTTFACFVTHTTSKEWPGNATSGGTDGEWCDSAPASAFVPGKYSGAPLGVFPPATNPVGWFSDWPALNHEQAATWDITVTDNGDGTVDISVLAHYPLVG